MVALPEIVGGLVLTGMLSSPTFGVAFEAAVCAPSPLVAVTRTRIRLPASARARTYCCVVAPPIEAQSEPSGRPPESGQRTHWKRYAVGLPVQIPRVAVRVEPTFGSPMMRGSVVFVGAASLAAVPAPVNQSRETPVRAAARPSRAFARLAMSKTSFAVVLWIAVRSVRPAVPPPTGSDAAAYGSLANSEQRAHRGRRRRRVGRWTPTGR